MKDCKDTFRCATIIIYLVGTSNCFWADTFGGENTNGIGGGATNCPKWATYFEAINTTIDCNRAVPMSALQGDRFCEKICETVNLPFVYKFQVS